MGLAPCKGCNDRKVGCHSNCKKYEEFRAEVDRVHEIRNLEKMKMGFAVEGVIRKCKEHEQIVRNIGF